MHCPQATFAAVVHSHHPHNRPKQASFKDFGTRKRTQESAAQQLHHPAPLAEQDGRCQQESSEASTDHSGGLETRFGCLIVNGMFSRAMSSPDTKEVL